MFNLILKFM